MITFMNSPICYRKKSLALDILYFCKNSMIKIMPFKLTCMTYFRYMDFNILNKLFIHYETLYSMHFKQISVILFC